MVIGGTARRWIALLSLASLGLGASACAQDRPNAVARAAPAAGGPTTTGLSAADVTAASPTTTPSTRSKVSVPIQTTTTINGSVRTTTTRPPAGWKAYLAPTGLRMNLPVGWQAQSPDGAEIDVFIDPYNARTVRYVIGEPVTGPAAESVGQYLALKGEEFAYIDAEITSKGRTTLSGREAYEWHYLAMSTKGVPLELWTVVTVQDGKGWKFTYLSDRAGYAGAEAQVRTVFESIDILE